MVVAPSSHLVVTKSGCDILYHSWWLICYRLPVPVLSLKQAFLWPVIRACTNNKSWGSESVCSWNWSFLHVKSGYFVTYCPNLQSDHFSLFHFPSFNSCPPYRPPKHYIIPTCLPVISCLYTNQNPVPVVVHKLKPGGQKKTNNFPLLQTRLENYQGTKKAPLFKQ